MTCYFDDACKIARVILRNAGSQLYLIASFVNSRTARRTPELLVELLRELLRELVGELLPSPYVHSLKALFLAYLVVSLVVFAIDSPCPLTPMTQRLRPVVPRQLLSTCNIPTKLL
jgi:hypothetical protein